MWNEKETEKRKENHTVHQNKEQKEPPNRGRMSRCRNDLPHFLIDIRGMVVVAEERKEEGRRGGGAQPYGCTHSNKAKVYLVVIVLKITSSNCPKKSI